MTCEPHYFRNGRRIAVGPGKLHIDAAIKSAKTGLITREAEFVRIIDVGGSCAEVASGNRSRIDRS